MPEAAKPYDALSHLISTSTCKQCLFCHYRLPLRFISLSQVRHSNGYSGRFDSVTRKCSLNQCTNIGQYTIYAVYTLYMLYYTLLCCLIHYISCIIHYIYMLYFTLYYAVLYTVTYTVCCIIHCKIHYNALCGYVQYMPFRHMCQTIHLLEKNWMSVIVKIGSQITAGMMGWEQAMCIEHCCNLQCTVQHVHVYGYKCRNYFLRTARHVSTTAHTYIALLHCHVAYFR